MDSVVIPPRFYEEAWLEAEHPMACVDPEHRLLRVNHAFANMLGYSVAEIEGRTWLSITRSEYVGGDLRSVERVIQGVTDHYRMEKQYIHKMGHYVSVLIIVRRYPLDKTVPLLYFQVEAIVTMPSTYELTEQMQTMSDEISHMKRLLEKHNSDQINIHMGDKAGGDNIGGDRNSDSAIKFVAGALVVIVAVVAWLFYYVVVANNGGRPEPPNTQPEATKTTQVIEGPFDARKSSAI